jgi:hypothetical protein
MNKKTVMIFFLLFIINVINCIEEPSISVKELIAQEIQDQEQEPLLNDDVLDFGDSIEEKTELKSDVEQVEPIFEKIEEKEIISPDCPTAEEELQKQEPIQETKETQEAVLDVAAVKLTPCNKRVAVADTPSKKPSMKTESKHNAVALKKESTERTVTICNQITDDMLTYKKHWSGHHSPSKFVVCINDQELKKGTMMPVKIKDDKLEITYSYEFRALGRVQRKGGKRIEFKVPKEVEKVCSTFSWDDHESFVLDKAQLVASYDIS